MNINKVLFYNHLLITLCLPSWNPTAKNKAKVLRQPHPARSSRRFSLIPPNKQAVDKVACRRTSPIHSLLSAITQQAEAFVSFLNSMQWAVGYPQWTHTSMKKWTRRFEHLNTHISSDPSAQIYLAVAHTRTHAETHTHTHLHNRK